MRQPFPSLVIRADSFQAQGTFAVNQATFLNPDPQVVSELREKEDVRSGQLLLSENGAPR